MISIDQLNRWLAGVGEAVTVSQVIAAAKDAGLIKADESETTSTRYARYLPFWA
jgi:ATP-dependent DNA helicase RecG